MKAPCKRDYPKTSHKNTTSVHFHAHKKLTQAYTPHAVKEMCTYKLMNAYVGTRNKPVTKLIILSVLRLKCGDAPEQMNINSHVDEIRRIDIKGQEREKRFLPDSLGYLNYSSFQPTHSLQ